MKRIFILFVLTFFFSNPCLADSIRIVQVDNLYFMPTNEQSVNNFNSVITGINRLKDVDFVVFSGNNISKPKKEYLESFIKTANKLKAPYYMIIGNKEVNVQKDFGKREYLEVLGKNIRFYKKITSANYVFEKSNTVFLVVDGAKEVIPSSMGYYKADTLSWLDNQLDQYKDKNVVILQHFPVVPPVAKESRYTYKAEEYLKVLNKHKNVKAVICGHFEVNKEDLVNDVLHISTKNAPSYRVIDILDSETSNPIFWSIIKE